MSSFWKFLGKEEVPTDDDAAGPTPSPQGDPVDVDIALTTPKAPPVAEGAKPKPALPMPRYGIDDAIKLMRTLPVEDNVDLVVRVIKKTLESLNVKVTDILEDASKRQESLRASISEHQTAIGQLEREIETRRNEIAHLEDELAETTTVRERLQLAEAMPAFKATPQTPAVTKKEPAGQSSPPSAGRSAPPLPKTYQPKLGGSTATGSAGATGSAAGERRGPMPTPPPNETAAKSATASTTTPDSPGFPTPPANPTAAKDSTSDDDDEQPVESRDLLEKAP